MVIKAADARHEATSKCCTYIKQCCLALSAQIRFQHQWKLQVILVLSSADWICAVWHILAFISILFNVRSLLLASPFPTASKSTVQWLSSRVILLPESTKVWSWLVLWYYEWGCLCIMSWLLCECPLACLYSQYLHNTLHNWWSSYIRNMQRMFCHNWSRLKQHTYPHTIRYPLLYDASHRIVADDIIADDSW